MTITSKFNIMCKTPSDINEHLPTLRKYAESVSHITECGVRSAVSSYAFADGLVGRSNTKLVQVDIYNSPNIEIFKNECSTEGLNTVFYEQSDLDCPIEKTDLLFIDTWHVYGHLKRELDRWNTHVSRYIILHDTTVDEWLGETIRCGWDADSQSIQSGIPKEEILKGLWPAVQEFLETHSDWVVKERFINNNGLTVLERIV